MAKNSNQGYKEKKKPKKNKKGNKIPGRTYPGSFPIMPDQPGTNTPGGHY